MGRLFACCLLLALGCAGAAAPGAETYLVLPFDNTSEAGNIEWIGESFSETIREALAAYGVSSIEREERDEAARRLSLEPGARWTKASAIRLAKDLGAGRLVLGRFRFVPVDESDLPAKGGFRVEAECIDVERWRVAGAWQEVGPMAELSRLLTRVAWRVLRAAAGRSAPAEKRFFQDHPPTRIDAVENYVRGLLEEDLEQKHRYLTQAVRLEPDFSQPHFRLGELRWEENSYRVAAGWLERVKPADAHYAEANFLLGLCRYHIGEHESAILAFERVARLADLAPNWNNLGLAQFRRGRPEAVATLRLAVEAEPSQPDYRFNTGYVLWRQGDLEGAAGQFRAVLALRPDDQDAQRLLERCRLGNGPRRGDLSTEGLERLQDEYEERGFQNGAGDAQRPDQAPRDAPAEHFSRETI